MANTNTDKTSKAADVYRHFSHPTNEHMHTSRTLRYVTTKKNGSQRRHCIAVYLPFGEGDEDVNGLHSCDRFDTIEEARACWKVKAAYYKERFGLEMEVVV